MLPYPSGTLHIGHIRNYSIGDALARYKWMRGFNVLHPMGWDAFGLPAENAAIANKRAAARVDARQHRGDEEARTAASRFSYDWDREVSTCEPEYYRWNQWFFLKMLERGLAYRKKALVNWCPQVRHRAGQRAGGGRLLLAPRRHARRAARAGAVVPQDHRLRRRAAGATWRKLEGGWPERVLTMQRNWIGRSEGAEIDFTLAGTGEPIRVFTTRVDTIYGATCVILAPEHPLDAEAARRGGPRARQGHGGRRAPAATRAIIEKEGFFTGHYAVNPYSGEKVPIWIAQLRADGLRHRRHHGRARRTTSAISNSAASTASRCAR